MSGEHEHKLRTQRPSLLDQARQIYVESVVDKLAEEIVESGEYLDLGHGSSCRHRRRPSRNVRGLGQSRKLSTPPSASTKRDRDTSVKHWSGWGPETKRALSLDQWSRARGKVTAPHLAPSDL